MGPTRVMTLSERSSNSFNARNLSFRNEILRVHGRKSRIQEFGRVISRGLATGNAKLCPVKLSSTAEDSFRAVSAKSGERIQIVSRNYLIGLTVTVRRIILRTRG